MVNRNRVIELDSVFLDSLNSMLKSSSAVHVYTLLHAFRKIYPRYVIDYYKGIYYLEYGKIYYLPDGTYIEGKTSMRRARKHLLRCAKTHPDNPKIMLALGETYYRERNYEHALYCFEQAYNSEQSNNRILWCILDTLCQLRRHKDILNIYTSYQKHFLPADDACWVWSNIVVAYAALCDEQTMIASDRLSILIKHIPEYIENFDVAIVTIIELLYVVGDFSSMCNLYTRYYSQIAHVESVCFGLLQKNKPK